jgi:hypothetical protein
VTRARSHHSPDHRWLLGLRESEAHVIRNAGGVVTDETDVRQSRPHQGKPVRPEQDLGQRVRLQRRHRQAERVA